MINLQRFFRSFLPTQRALLLALLPLTALAAAEFWPLAAALIPPLLLGSGLLLWRDVRRTPRPADLHVRREHHRKLSLNVENPIDLVLENRGGTAVFVQIRDEVPATFCRSARDKLLRAQLPPRQQKTLTYSVKPTRRGEHAFERVHLRWESVLGLFTRQTVIPLTTEAKVYPNLLQIREYDELARRGQIAYSGLRPMRSLGDAGEFEQLRDYLPDDDYRRISWKATARYGRPITVDFSPERSQNIVLLVDTGRQMMSRPLGVARTTRLDLIVNAVLLFSHVAIARGDRVGILTFDERVHRYLPPRAGHGQFYSVVESLYDATARPVETNYATALQYLQTQRLTRALIVLLTDPAGEEAADGLVAHLGAFYPHHLPLCVTLSNPTVLDTARLPPYSMDVLYQRAVAEQILDDRQLWLNRLRQRGVQTLDVPAYELTGAVINRYLEMKEYGRL